MIPLPRQLSSLLAFLLCWQCPIISASEPEVEPSPAAIYPTPQECHLSKVYTHVSNITYTQLQSGESIAKGSVEDGVITLPEVEGAYAILIKKGELQVFSYDAAGRHYAKQTLIQLLDNPLLSNTLTAQQDPYPENFDEGIARLGKLPIGTIVDWPDLPYRGVVEGYYGRPWSHDDRKQQIRFYARNKLNTYIWAPKDDPYHHGEDCRTAYPDDVAAQISELCELAAKNHVKFVWAIHPADTIDWEKEGGQPDLKALLTKLEQMYELGVRHFACFVDDSSGNISQASRQAELCNYIDEHFIKQHEDLEALIMCPTGYCKIWTPAAWLTELGQKLNPDIKPMWTGDSVIANITKAGQEWVHQALGRPSFIWWNWPCNDYKRSQLAMGRTYGLDQDPAMKQLLSGLVANPMEWAEASKVGLFGVADYTWNIANFDSVQSWKTGIARLYPTAAEALTRFCGHNADMGRHSDGYKREESTAIQQAAAALRQALGKAPLPPPATQQLHQEFVAICDSGIQLKQDPELANLRQEIGAWFQLYTRMGRVGKHALQLLQPKLAGDSPSKLSDLLQAWTAMEDSQNSELRPKVGTVILAPLVMDCAHAAARHYYRELSGKSAVEQKNSIQFSHSQGSDNAGSEKIFDQNTDSFGQAVSTKPWVIGFNLTWVPRRTWDKSI
ncbi:MAG: beta-N-acetylglucosaminidase domain-containing protein [Akkermansia sp.]